MDILSTLANLTPYTIDSSDDQLEDAVATLNRLISEAKAVPAEPYFCEGSRPMLTLEAMVDRVGAANVLHALSHICHAKADHVESNHQDIALRNAWNFNANACSGTANRLKRTF